MVAQMCTLQLRFGGVCAEQGGRRNVPELPGWGGHIPVSQLG